MERYSNSRPRAAGSGSFEFKNQRKKSDPVAKITFGEAIAICRSKYGRHASTVNESISAKLPGQHFKTDA